MLQLKGCEITRNGVYDADDTNILPNIDRGDLPSYWKGNNGIQNTYVGGVTQVTSEETTVVVAGSTYYDLEGVFLGTQLQHFEATADGKLSHLGENPIMPLKLVNRNLYLIKICYSFEIEYPL